MAANDAAPSKSTSPVSDSQAAPAKPAARRGLLRQYELIDRVRAYHPTADEDLLNKAYVFAIKMHGSQTRASGDPYFAHPIEVAGILTDYKLDTASIVTALLHDVIEDTDASRDDIENFAPDREAGFERKTFRP